MPVCEHADQLTIRESVTDQTQDDVTIPTRQDDRPVTGDGANACGQLEFWDEATLDDLEVNAVFESQYEMRSDIEQGGQEIKREVAAIKQVGPARAPGNLRGRLQIVDFARGGEDELLRYPFDPVKNTRDLGRAGLLAVLRPVVSRQRELNQAGVYGGDARELLTRLLKLGSVMR